MRIPWSNLINSLATCNALYRYAKARLRNERLSWLKTEHNYPNKQALIPYVRRLGEVLCDQQLCTHEEVEAALAAKPETQRLGEYLLAQSRINEEQLYTALSILSALPFEPIEATQVDARLTRCFPRELLQAHQLLPMRLDAHRILLATPEIPPEDLAPILYQYTRRELVFQLLTPTNFSALQNILDQQGQLSWAS